MAVTSRLRSVPPSMFSDELLLELPPAVRLTGLGLRFFADDYGRQTANPRLIKAQLWPLTEEVDEAAIDEHMLELDEVGYIRLYDVDHRTYFELVEWPSVDTRSSGPSRVPLPPLSDASPTTPDSSTPTLAGSSRESHEPPAVVGGREGRKEGEGAGVGGKGSVGGGAAALAAIPEPSPFCSKHPIGTEDKCGPCGGARKRHEAWVKAQVDQESGGAV